jgi:hypothetical protein
MLNGNHSKKAIKSWLLAAIWVIGNSFSAKAGIDSYQVFLNNKLVLQQSVLDPLNLSMLSISKANLNDKLVIYYAQCHAANKIGKSRRLFIRDEAGNMVKEWKYQDNEGTSGMEVPVKELLELENKFTGSTLTIYYIAAGMGREQRLIAFAGTAKAATRIKTSSSGVNSTLLAKR